MYLINSVLNKFSALLVVDIILSCGGVEPAFNLKVEGQANFGFILGRNSDIQHKEIDIKFESTFKVIVEASATFGGSIVGFVFIGGDWKGDTSVEYKLYSETGLIGALSIGSDYQGVYINVKVKFSGIVCAATKETKSKKRGTKSTKELANYVIVEQKTIIGGKYYLN